MDDFVFTEKTVHLNLTYCLIKRNLLVVKVSETWRTKQFSESLQTDTRTTVAVTLKMPVHWQL